MYYIIYYCKRYWYIFTTLTLLSFLCIVIYLNRGELISHFEEFNNKVVIEPDEVTVSTIDDIDSKLSDIIVGAPYLGSNGTYIPSSISDGEKISYLRQLAKDPTYVYKKNINWSNGSLTSEELTDLVELVGFHLNKKLDNTYTVVSLPTTEQLVEGGEEVYYYTDDNGILYINLFVEEVNILSSESKTYLHTYKLKYNMEGKVDIS